MNMPKRKSCKTCALCKEVYRAFGYEMFSFGRYLCAVTEDFTDRDKVCERWQEKVRACDFSAARFQKAEEDIAAIKQMIENKD